LATGKRREEEGRGTEGSWTFKRETDRKAGPARSRGQAVRESGELTDRVENRARSGKFTRGASHKQKHRKWEKESKGGRFQKWKFSKAGSNSDACSAKRGKGVETVRLQMGAGKKIATPNHNSD